MVEVIKTQGMDCYSDLAKPGSGMRKGSEQGMREL